MINSRLIFIETTSPNIESAQILEKIDAYLDESKYLRALGVALILYGKRGESTVMVGREIQGREEEAYHLEAIKLADFSMQDSEKKAFKFENLDELLIEVRKTVTKFENYRIEVSLSEPNQANVLFF